MPLATARYAGPEPSQAVPATGGRSRHPRCQGMLQNDPSGAALIPSKPTEQTRVTANIARVVEGDASPPIPDIDNAALLGLA